MTTPDLMRRIAADRKRLADICRGQDWADDMLEQMDFAILTAFEARGPDDDPRVTAGEATNEIVRLFFGLDQQGTALQHQEGTTSELIEGIGSAIEPVGYLSGPGPRCTEDLAPGEGCNCGVEEGTTL